MTICQICTVDLMAFCFLRYRMQDLRERGHRNVVICQVDRFRADLERVADEVIDVPIPRTIRPWQDLVALVRLVRVLRRVKPDLIHTHSSKAGILGRLAGRIAGVPLVVHTIYDLPQNYARRPLVKWLYRELERWTARLCDHLFTISEANLEQIVAEGIARREDVSIVRPGLEMHLFADVKSREEQRRLWGVPEDSPLIGMVARLEPAKDQDSLLRAFASLQHPTARLVITGRGHREATLRALAQELGIAERVLFTGWVENQLDAINALDLFVLASHYEGLGVVLLEALALHVPVISTLVGGTRDVLRHDKTGLFVPPRDPLALAAAIDDMLSHPERARALAEAGRKDVLQRYLVEDSNRELYAVYERLWSAASTS